MAECIHVVGSLEDVRAYVLETFCSRFDLDPRFFSLREFPVCRRRQVVGLYFVLEGPRRLRFNAVWDYRSEMLLFYGMNGQRIQTTRLICANMASAQAA